MGAAHGHGDDQQWLGERKLGFEVDPRAMVVFHRSQIVEGGEEKKSFERYIGSATLAPSRCFFAGDGG